MPDLIDTLNRIHVHVGVLTQIPSNEQNLGNIQTVLAEALKDVVKAIELLARMDGK